MDGMPGGGLECKGYTAWAQVRYATHSSVTRHWVMVHGAHAPCHALHGTGYTDGMGCKAWGATTGAIQSRATKCRAQKWGNTQHGEWGAGHVVMGHKVHAL